MKLTAYFQNNLVRYGSIGAFIAALCCFTPLLVVGLAALGLAGLTAYFDFVLLPVLFVSLGILALGVQQVQKHQAATCESPTEPEADVTVGSAQ